MQHMTRTSEHSSFRIGAMPLSTPNTILLRMQHQFQVHLPSPMVHQPLSVALSFWILVLSMVSLVDESLAYVLLITPQERTSGSAMTRTVPLLVSVWCSRRSSLTGGICCDSSTAQSNPHSRYTSMVTLSPSSPTTSFLLYLIPPTSSTSTSDSVTMSLSIPLV